MKRIGGLYSKIVDIDNLRLADKKARKGKRNTYGVKLFDKDPEGNILKIQKSLIDGTYSTSEYSIYTIYEPKEREIYRLPYKDRVVHHAIMNVLEPIWVSIFNKSTYSCIKGMGVHKALKDIKKALKKDRDGAVYCLKLDIRKYYPSIDHDILKKIIRKKIKCKRTLDLLDGIIDSAPGVPIGNYLSQFFANLYLAYFDHEVKERLKVKYYYRYADDLVLLSGSKAQLHGWLVEIREMLSELKLTIKPNYQVFPIEVRGLDFLGYVIRRDYVLLRKSIKKRFIRKYLKSMKKDNSWWAYKGWTDHCNSRNLIKKMERIAGIGNNHLCF